MILPVLYLKGGIAVKVNGEKLGDGDARQLAQRLGRVGDIIVIDLDASLASAEAKTENSSKTAPSGNAALIKDLLQLVSCRVAGGISTIEAALEWLNAGVTKVILGSNASQELLEALPPSRTVVAVDVQGNDDDPQVVLHNRTSSDSTLTLSDRLSELFGLTEEFLITFVDMQGKCCGLPKDGSVVNIINTVSKCGTTVGINGGLTSSEDIETLDKLGLIPVIGTALHEEKLQLGAAVCTYLRSDRPDGLYPTTVVDEQGIALGLVYSDDASIVAALDKGKGIYHSRKRGLWEKGLTSGAAQDLIRIDLDCDRDAIRFTVKQHGAGFCHLGRRTCWSEDAGLGALMRTLESRVKNPVAGSYTNRLLSDSDLLNSKLREECEELIEAKEHDDIAWEAADVIYFAAVMCARAGVGLKDVERMLDRRSLRVTRRKGDAKPPKPKPTGSVASLPDSAQS